MKINYLLCFILFSSICLEISANSFTELVRTILDQFSVKSQTENHVAKAEPVDYEISCGVSNYDKFEDRIVGGEIAKPNEFPWLVSIQVYIDGKYYHNCGGTVVHSSFILTAGHCVFNVPVNIIFIVAGIYRLDEQEDHEQRRSVRKVWHEPYKPKNFEGDIGLIKLEEPLNLVPGFIVPGCLPIGNEKFKDYAIAAGWGRLSEEGTLPNETRKVILPIYDFKKCTKNYKDQRFGAYMHDCQLCTYEYEKDSCQGDSGGPLMCINKNDNKTYICGIVSWGAGCARRDSPGVYTQVACYTDWISKKIRDNK